MRSKTVLLLLATALLAGCNHGGSSPHATALGSPSPTLSPKPSPTRPPSADPLTGRALVRGPVVAMKVDNALLARPYQRGLRQAAIVYQELVEGGSTRFMAIFESASATHEVGPVRSARESDLDILRAYGHPALAFSGAQPGVFAIVRAAVRAGHVVDASYDSSPRLYRLGERRRDARNFFAVPEQLAEHRGGSGPTDIGLRFGALMAGGAPTRAATATFSPTSVLSIRYDARTGTYVLSQHGRVIPVSPVNIIVQVVATHPSRFHDVHGMNTPLTVSTGRGRAIVLRDGVRFAAAWQRAGYGATHYRTAAGRDVLLKPGPTWVLLLPQGRTVTFA